MKKTLAIILAIVMVFAFTTTAFAVKTDIVGEVNTGEAVLDDGKTEAWFQTNGGSTSANIAITAETGNIEHRYAVDITYEPLSFNIAGAKLTWDVNNLKYVQTQASTAMTNTVFPITVSNRSDMPVDLAVNITDKVDDATDYLTLAFYESDAAVDGESNVTGTKIGGVIDTIIAPANIGTAGASGSPTDYPFALVATSTNWENVANYYANIIAASGDTKAVVANLSITVSMPTNP